MKRELEVAATQANIDREQTRDQAALDRQHSADEAHVERLTITRRQVYLDAVDGLGKAQMFLGSMGRQDVADLDYQANMGPLLVAVNKVAVVGEMYTVHTARELTSMINRRFFRAIVQLMPSSLYRGRIAIHHAEWEAAQVEIKRILAALTNHNETVKDDPDGFAMLMNSFQAQQKRSEVASANEQKAHLGMAGAQMEYGDFVIAGAGEVALHLDLLVQSVRKELNIATDFEAFRAQTLRMTKTVAEAMAEMKAGIAQYQADAKAGKYDG
jgi:hypothetical protein